MTAASPPPRPSVKLWFLGCPVAIWALQRGYIFVKMMFSLPSPVRCFLSPSRSIRVGVGVFVSVSEANGPETPRQKQNAHACVTF